MHQTSSDVIILAIESSCDDTSAAVLVNGKICSNIIANQSVHIEYGGVVPELASRAHEQHIIPVVDQAIKKANILKTDINAVAFTKGPGLIGSLLVGASFAKGFALAKGLPLIGVHHMQAHVLAHFIDEPVPKFPFLCLTVSGGHTQIVLVSDYLNMQIIGQTIDDAAGEAFDKTAKLLGLPYPGGPLIDKYAQLGNPNAFLFPFPRTANPLDFSFSGLKTSVLIFLQKGIKNNPNFVNQHLNDICASVQHTIVQILIQKLIKAAKQFNISEIAIAGGVSANSGLRTALIETGKKYKWQTYIPAFEYCTDNAAMIGIAGYYKFLKSEFSDLDVTPAARMAI